MDAEQLQALVQMVSTGGALAVLIAWIRSLQDDLKYVRKELEDAQEEHKKALQTQVEWLRYEQTKNLPRDDTRPLPPRWQGELRERIEDN